MRDASAGVRRSSGVGRIDGSFLVQVRRHKLKFTRMTRRAWSRRWRMMTPMGRVGTEQEGVVYQIVVRGEVGESAAEEIGAQRVQPMRGRTLIVVEIIDQAHLHGVLDRLADLNIEIESVNPA